MKVTIKSTNLDLTPEIKRAVEEKIATLDKFIPHIDPVRSNPAKRDADAQAHRTSNGVDALVEAFVEVALETRHHKKGKIYYAEATIKVPGKIIRAEAKGEDIYQAINEVKDELQGILEQYKERKIAKRDRAI